MDPMDRTSWADGECGMGSSELPIWRRILLCGIATTACATVLRVAAGETNAPDNWTFDVAPYLWVAGVDVETNLPSTPSGVGRFDTRIGGGACRLPAPSPKHLNKLAVFSCH